MMNNRISTNIQVQQRSNNQERFVISELRKSFDGKVIGPEDPEYDEARAVFHGGIDRKPAVIIRPKNTTEASRVVSLAAKTGLDLAIRSGGHSTAGHSVIDGGIVLDLADMRDLQIDVENQSAWAGAGLTAGEYTTAAGVYGLATGFGDTGSVGIGGLTLGGGIGYLVRKHALTIDQLLAAEIVTADGQVHLIDEDANPDLFWAIRGGGGNFGVVTRFQFRLHKVDSVLGGMLFLPATPETITSFIAEAYAAPDELSIIATVMNAPPMPFLPVEIRGTPIIMAMLVYAGEVEEGNRVLKPFKTIAPPVADMIHPMSYPEIYISGPGGGHALMATRTMFMDMINRSAAETILNHLQSSTASMAVVQLRVLGGAMARVPVDATAFAHRKSRILVNIAAMYQEPFKKAEHESWADEFMPAIRQNDSGAYVNFLGDEGDARVRAAYPGRTWERLTSIKARYDPTNLFHLNQNIPPLLG